MASVNEMLYYTAGFFDGEGCASIGGSNFTPMISFCNTNEAVLDAILTFFQIMYRINFKKHKEIHAERKTVYRLHLYGSGNVLAFCKLIEPLCIVRGQRLKIMINYLEDCYSHRKPVPEDEILMRKYYYTVLKDLNR